MERLAQTLVVCTPGGMDAEHVVGRVETPVLACRPAHRLANHAEGGNNGRFDARGIEENPVDLALQTQELQLPAGIGRADGRRDGSRVTRYFRPDSDAACASHRSSAGP
jgi:hypothetical protein